MQAVVVVDAKHEVDVGAEPVAAQPRPVPAWSDEDCLPGLRRGEQWAQEAMVRQFGPIIMAFLLKIRADYADAEDIRQETLLRVMKRIDGYRGESPFRAWVLKIAHSMFQDLLRRLRGPRDRKRLTLEEVEDVAEAPPDLGANASAQEEKARLLERLLEMLEPTQRQIVQLRVDCGMSYIQVGLHLAKSESAARRLFFRARARLEELCPRGMRLRDLFEARLQATCGGAG